jgi:hypothetical protein
VHVAENLTLIIEHLGGRDNTGFVLFGLVWVVCFLRQDLAL